MISSKLCQSAQSNNLVSMCNASGRLIAVKCPVWT